MSENSKIIQAVPPWLSAMGDLIPMSGVVEPRAGSFLTPDDGGDHALVSKAGS
jgi:hypothetical protein